MTRLKFAISIFIVPFLVVLLSAYLVNKFAITPWTTSFQISLASLIVSLLALLSISIYKLWVSRKVLLKMLAVLILMPLIVLLFLSATLIENSGRGYTRLANVVLNFVPASQKSGLDEFPYSLTKEQWQQDIHYLKERLPKQHANLFLYLPEKEFYNSIEELEADLPKLSDQQIAWEICRLMSTIKDGHTQVISIPFNVPPFQDSHLFPLRLFHFEDGWYVVRADKDHAYLLGKKLLRINDVLIDKVEKVVAEYIPGENKYYKMQWAFPYLLNAGLLNYKGIISTSKQTNFTFQNSAGEETSEMLEPVLAPLYLRWYRATRNMDDLSRRSNLDLNYWYETDVSEKSIFVQINQVQSQDGRLSLKSFSKEVDSLITNLDIGRLIIDLRNCNGGDNSRLAPLVKLVQNPKINKQGRLFVLIGRQTFSGGVSLAAAIERNSKVVFVGEPAGSGPNQCGDVQRVTLPNSKLILQVSGRYHQQGYFRERRLAIEPQVPVSYSYSSWNSMKDPALGAINSYTYKTDSLEVFANENPIIGKYKFDEEKVMEIKKEGGKLWLEVKDYETFLRTELYPLNYKEFNTDISHVSLRIVGKENTLLLKWANLTDTLTRLPTEYVGPAQLILAGRYEEAIAAYRKGKVKGFHFSSYSESAINFIGYQLIAEKKLEMANNLFLLNSELFPTSNNVWDSLAESYLLLNNKEEARKSCEHALELNPENQNVRRMLMQME